MFFASYFLCDLGLSQASAPANRVERVRSVPSPL